MKNKDKYSQENNKSNKVNEPLAKYEMTFSPPLTEDELKEAITRDELLEYIFDKIDKLPGK